jgi:hypothetical protein
MAVVNIIGLYCLMPIVKRELNSYLDRMKSGEINKYKYPAVNDVRGGNARHFFVD